MIFIAGIKQQDLKPGKVVLKIKPDFLLIVIL